MIQSFVSVSFVQLLHMLDQNGINIWIFGKEILVHYYVSWFICPSFLYWILKSMKFLLHVTNHLRRQQAVIINSKINYQKILNQLTYFASGFLNLTRRVMWPFWSLNQSEENSTLIPTLRLSSLLTSIVTCVWCMTWMLWITIDLLRFDQTEC